MDTLSLAFGMVFQPAVLATVAGAACFGLVVGAIPGLTATMAIALLVPVTFFMDPVPAIGAMVACSAMAIFAGDIPGTLLRIPGTPASAAYTDEAFAMTRKGEGELALGANLLFSAVGGLFGTAILILAAPALAEVALKFSSFEYFWMALLGLTSAVFIGTGSPLKGLVSLGIGLLVATIGFNNPAGVPRFTFGSTELMGGVDFIAAMIGMFAVAEVFRYLLAPGAEQAVPQGAIGNLFRDWGGMLRRYWPQQVRGNLLGTAIGALPGAGADIAAWIAYAVSKKWSKTPERFGTGHLEGIVESTSANNAALGGCLGAGPGLRHPGRFDHSHRDRRALRQGHEPGADGVPQQSREHLRRLHHLHPCQPRDDPARLGGDQARQADPLDPAPHPDALHPGLLHRGRLRDQQLDLRDHHHPGHSAFWASSWRRTASRSRPRSWAWYSGRCSRRTSSPR